MPVNIDGCTKVRYCHVLAPRAWLIINVNPVIKIDRCYALSLFTLRSQVVFNLLVLSVSAVD